VDYEDIISDIETFHAFLVERGEEDPLPGPPSGSDRDWVVTHLPTLAAWYVRHDGGAPSGSGMRFLPVADIRSGTVTDEWARVELDMMRQLYDESHLSWPPGTPFASAQGFVYFMATDGNVLSREVMRENWKTITFAQLLEDIARVREMSFL